MPMRLLSYRTRQLALAALTANAVRPPREPHAGVGAFVPGWLTGELAPQLLTTLALDTGSHLLRHGRRSDRAALALAAASAVGLGRILIQSLRARDALDNAVAEAYPGAPAVRETIDWKAVARPLKAVRTTPPGVRVVRDLQYAGTGPRGRLDLYLPDELTAGAPKAAQAAPVLVQIHGGGWVLGRKDQQGVPLMHRMAARGWVCVAINYRLAPAHPLPTQIIDVKRALAWVRAHIEEWGGDPRYLAVTGGSAGGHLAALAALTPGDPEFQPGFEDADTTVQCAVPFYGVYDLAGASGLHSAQLLRDRFLAPRVFGREWSQDPALFEATSPLLRVNVSAPDFFVIHGGSDSLVEVAQGRLFAERLRAVSAGRVGYAELPGAQHAFDVFPSIRTELTIAAVETFLTRHRTDWLAEHDPTDRAAP